MTSVAVSVYLDDVNAFLDHVLQGGSRHGAIRLVSLWRVDAVQSDSGSIHQDNRVAVSDSIDFDVAGFLGHSVWALAG
jgi:hypothetical protein